MDCKFFFCFLLTKCFYLADGDNKEETSKGEQPRKPEADISHNGDSANDTVASSNSGFDTVASDDTVAPSNSGSGPHGDHNALSIPRDTESETDSTFETIRGRYRPSVSSRQSGHSRRDSHRLSEGRRLPTGQNEPPGGDRHNGGAIQNQQSTDSVEIHSGGANPTPNSHLSSRERVDSNPGSTDSLAQHLALETEEQKKSAFLFLTDHYSLNWFPDYNTTTGQTTGRLKRQKQPHRNEDIR